LEEFSAPEFAVPPVSPAGAPKHPGAPELQDLGKQSIAGLETVGTRETIVIPTGALGNNSPLLMKREFWYSPKLGVNLVSKRQDPLSGIQNFEVSSVVLGEPDTKLFQVPSGSKILDLRKPPEVSLSPTPAPN
jgi:hypothetical protein